MGHAPSVLDEPLKPTHKITQPPWVPRYLGKKYEYKGRMDWWADIGYEEPLLHKGQFRGIYPNFREEDKYWLDPELPQGESVHGLYGLDTRYHKDFSKKGDRPGKLWDYQQEIIKNSTQYKQIAEKWKLSPEHPGLAVSPNLTSLHLVPPKEIGKDTFIYTRFHQYGPRFWDKPLNEGCVEKGLTMAKYAAYFMIFPVTFAQIRGKQALSLAEMRRVWPIFKLYFKNLPIPCTLAFTYGISWCTAANIRRKDDFYNVFLASAATGLVLGTIKHSTPPGILCGLAVCFFGCYYQYLRYWPCGIEGRVAHQMINGTHFGPLSYKIFEGRELPPPKEKY